MILAIKYLHPIDDEIADEEPRHNPLQAGVERVTQQQHLTFNTPSPRDGPESAFLVDRRAPSPGKRI